MLHGRALTICLFVGLLWLAISAPTYAYLDPGTGSYIFQLLLAGIVGLAFLVKVFWTRIKRFFKALFARKEGHSEGSRDAE